MRAKNKQSDLDQAGLKSIGLQEVRRAEANTLREAGRGKEGKKEGKKERKKLSKKIASSNVKSYGGFFLFSFLVQHKDTYVQHSQVLETV
jgi:hypothetical protein